MKKIILIIMLIAVAVISCKKEKLENSVYGTWKLTNAGGGYSTPSTGLVNVSVVKNEVYQFKKDGTYIKYIDEKIVNQGTFVVKFDGEFGDYNTGLITFTNPNFSDVFKYKSGTIIIGNGAFDGPINSYSKVNGL